ncbi:hypothetical protein BDR04DRAFT_1160797 [Suillus decipiens]|nr:hypothetical protein BDR04DRAFT_1160797 [Suillus decipiens]
MKILETLLLLKVTLLLNIPLLLETLLLKVTLLLEIPPLLDMPLLLEIPLLLDMSLLLDMPLCLLTIQELACNARLSNLCCDMEFILALQEALLDDGIGLTGDALECLQNPPRHRPEFGSADVEYGVTLFLALKHSSEDAFHKTCAATLA